MEFNRINSILNNKEKTDIFYADRPVWIQEINNNKAIYTKEEKKFLNKATGVLALNILGEKKAKEILNNINVGGDGDMLAVFDMIREEKLKDINIGRKEGRLQAKIEDIKNMLKEKLPIDLISRITGVSEEEIEKYTNLK